MKQTKPIVTFDLETTGLSTTKDRIVEIYMLKINTDGTEEELYSRFNPGIDVPTHVAEIHGMDNETLANEPKFAEKAKDIIEFIKDSDLSGYNIIKFDIPLLIEELNRVGIVYNFKQHKVFDSYLIWTKCESRDLSGAVRRFLGEKMENAHNAKPDVVATSKILMKQFEEYSDRFETPEEMADETSGLKEKLDFSGKFARNEENQIVITFGKHKDKPVQQVHKEDAGYLKWIFEMADFASDTKNLAKQIYEKLNG